MGPVQFSIVTPSFRQLPWLKRCVRSVADQGVNVEHIVQDAGTGPELESWAQTEQGVKLYVEPDSGMYQALNRGLARATADGHGEGASPWVGADDGEFPGTAPP